MGYMTNDNELAAIADLSDAVFDHVHRYQPTLLTEGQSHRMLADIKAAVLSAEPTSKTNAGHMLSTLCRFVADTAPLVGCPLDEVLTDPQLARWTQRRELERGAGRGLATAVGHLRRILRGRKGMPAQIAEQAQRRVATPPLASASLRELLECCSDGPALRGLAASFGTGVVWGEAVGGFFERCDAGLTLNVVAGTRHRVIPAIDDLGQLDGATVLDGDWDALRRLASSRRIYFDTPIMRQTYRELVLSQPASLRDLTVVYGLSCKHLDDIQNYLAPVDLTADTEVVEMLRGPLLRNSPAVA